MRATQIGINPAGYRPVFLREHTVNSMRVLSRQTVSLRPDISYQMPFMKLLVKEQIVNPETGELSSAKLKAAFGQKTFFEKMRGCVSTRFRDPDIEEVMKACLGRIITPHEDNFSENHYADRSLRHGFIPMETPEESKPLPEIAAPVQTKAAVEPAITIRAKAPFESGTLGAPVSTAKQTASSTIPAKPRPSNKRRYPTHPTVAAKLTIIPAVPERLKRSGDAAVNFVVQKHPPQPLKKSDEHGIHKTESPKPKTPAFIPATLSLTITLPYEVMSLPPELMIKLPKHTIGQRIEAIRESRGLKKSELANAAGIGTSTYAYVENRDSLPNPHQLFAISKALNVAPESIIYGMPFEDVISTLSEGTKIIFLRLRHGWTQQDLADKMNNVVTRSTINYWEQDKTFPEGDILEALRNALEYGDIHTNSRHVYLGRASEEPKLLAVALRMKKGRTVINPGTLSALSGLSLTTARNFLKDHPEYGYSVN